MLLLPLLHSGEVLSAIFWRILPEALNHLFVGKVSSWHELNQRKSIEANQVSQKALSTASAVITVVVDQRVAVHASVADHLESLSVRERL